MKSFLKIIVYLNTIILLLSITSCIDDEYSFSKLDDSTEANWGLPPFTLGSTTISLDKLIENIDSTRLPQEDQDGFYTIYYRKDLNGIKAESIIEMPKQVIKKDNLLNLPIETVFIKFDTTFIIQADFQYSSNQSGESVDSIKIREMDIKISMLSTLNCLQKMIVKFPKIKKNGVAFVDTVTCNGPSSGCVPSTKSLEGYTLILDQTPSEMSYIPIECKYISESAPNNRFGPGNVGFEVEMSNLVYTELHGYLGNYQLLNDTSNVETSFLDNPITENLTWDNPQLNLYIYNTYGIPMKFTISELSGLNLKTNEKKTITFNGSTTFTKLLTTTTFDKRTTNLDIIPFNKNNSTIRDLFNESLGNITAVMKVEANPDTLTKERSNYVTDTSQIKTTLEVLLPLQFSSKGFGTTDTMEMDLAQLSAEGSQLKSFLLRFNTENDFPVDAQLKILFADNNYNIVDSLSNLNDKLLVAGTIDPITGHTSPSNSVIDYLLEPSEYEKLSKVKYAFLTFNLKTPDNEMVKLFSDYQITITVSLHVRIIIGGSK